MQLVNSQTSLLQGQRQQMQLWKLTGDEGRKKTKERKVVLPVHFNGRANIVQIGGEQTEVRYGPGQNPDEMKREAS